MKKRSYWVLFAVMLLVGAFLMVFVGSQNQLPVITDVNAQNQDLGFYTTPGSYISGNFGGPHISSSFESNVPQLWTILDCQQPYPLSELRYGMQWPAQFLESIYEPTPTGLACTSPTTINCTGYVCGGGGNTMLFCPTSMNCGGQTSLNCTALACGGGTSGICGSGTWGFCSGGYTSGMCGGFLKGLGGVGVGMGYISGGYSSDICGGFSGLGSMYQSMGACIGHGTSFCSGVGMGSLGAMSSFSATPGY